MAPGLTDNRKRRKAMRKGIIFYVVEGKETPMASDGPELDRLARRLGVNAVRLASSEDEIAYGWWQLVTKGVQEVMCAKARLDESGGQIEPFGTQLRLCG